MTTEEKRVFIGQFYQSGRNISDVLQEGMEWIDAASIIKNNTRVFIKPNLTWKVPTPGVTTTPIMLRAVVEALTKITSYISIVESDGGQQCFWAEDAFLSHGLYNLAHQFNIRVINLSKEPSKIITTQVDGKNIQVRLPSVLLEEMDFFITMPVPKIHAMTRVSMAFKNQWGCLGNSMRVKDHPRFNKLIVAINKLLKPRLAICDGTYFLNKTGPMFGEAVRKNLLLVGDDIGAISLACSEIMGIDYRKVKHFQVARKEGMFPKMQNVRFNRHPRQFLTRQFHLKRTPINYIQLAAFHNIILNKVFYDSFLADAMHKMLWFISKNLKIKKFLYGHFGPGEAKRHGVY